MKRQILAITCASLTLPILAAEPAAEKIDLTKVNKSQYSLFNRTPSEFLREMSTDRPDKTESAYTVDAGHFQIETDLISYSHDHDRSGGADTKVDAWAITPINFKVGLNNRIDLQTVIETYNHITTKDRVAGTTVRQSGFGDITSRLKVNFWGNDGGTTAFAAMPFVKFPTSQDQIGNNSVEGGIILPLAVELPAGWGMGVMTELDINRNDGRSGHHAEFVNSITFAHDIVGKLGGYAEFFSAVSAESGAKWVGTVDLGLTYGLTDNIQLDAGVNIGLTKSADDINPFIGLSWRF
ncbi:MAG: transporter [Pedosphaera sp.]|nr:transporter [Pedosphaera sp.]